MKLIDKVRATAPEGVAKIAVAYYGGADSFEGFHSTTLYDAEGKEMEEVKLTKDLDEDELWKVLEQSDADFNNGGSEGHVIFDFVANEIRVENFYRVEHLEAGGGCTYKDPEE